MPQCGMAPDAVLDKLEAAFSKRRADLLVTDEGRWALFVQPRDKRRRPQFIGCFDDEHQACSAGFRSTLGRRFLIKEVLEKDRVISIPWVGLADRR